MIPPHPLTNIEIQIYYQNEPAFTGLYSRDIFSDEVKDGAYIINLHEYPDIGTHWVALYVNTKTVAYFDSFFIKNLFSKIPILKDIFFECN